MNNEKLVKVVEKFLKAFDENAYVDGFGNWCIDDAGDFDAVLDELKTELAFAKHKIFADKHAETMVKK